MDVRSVGKQAWPANPTITSPMDSRERRPDVKLSVFSGCFQLPSPAGCTIPTPTTTPMRTTEEATPTTDSFAMADRSFSSSVVIMTAAPSKYLPTNSKAASV